MEKNPIKKSRSIGLANIVLDPGRRGAQRDLKRRKSTTEEAGHVRLLLEVQRAIHREAVKTQGGKGRKRIKSTKNLKDAIRVGLRQQEGRKNILRYGCHHRSSTKSGKRRRKQ